MVYSKEKTGNIKELYSAHDIGKRIEELGKTISDDF